MNSKLSKMVRQLISVVLLVTFTFASQGCNKLSREYGISEGAEARQSPAAISIFRNLCDSEGCDTKEVRSLSPRAMDRLKAIVWSPNHFGAHRSETFEWMNQWLASGDRTLVYVGRDFSAMEDYWRQCSEKLLQAENNQEERWNCLEQIAIAQRELDQLRSSVRQNVATPWFLFDYTNSVEKQVKSVSGPWADSIDMSKSRIFLRGVPVGMNHRSYSDLKKYLIESRLLFRHLQPPTPELQPPPRIRSRRPRIHRLLLSLNWSGANRMQTCLRQSKCFLKAISHD